MCSRWRVFAKRGSAWSEMPDEAASEMIATRFVPAMKASFSAMLIWSCETPFCARASQRVPPAPSLTKRILRPVISATCSTPKWPMTRSSALEGMSIASRRRSSAFWISTASSTTGCATNPKPLVRPPPSCGAPSARVVGRCCSISERAISCGVETSLSSSRPARFSRSAASLALASPVERRPMTTHFPCRNASSVSSIALRALIELRSCLKKDWCAPQYRRSGWVPSLPHISTHFSSALSMSSHSWTASSYSRSFRWSSVHSRTSKEQPVKASMRETNIPRAFMSIASSSIAPTPARSILVAKVEKSGKGVPRPHSPSRDMYPRSFTSAAAVALT
mmetsp:Transcript_8926/g.29614  ORF Transcript_8926/g.29614 Transcript_8926/m.29614 type:complete len:336 (+) Transcript_8926:3294-4301(+)